MMNPNESKDMKLEPDRPPGMISSPVSPTTDHRAITGDPAEMPVERAFREGNFAAERPKSECKASPDGYHCGCWYRSMDTEESEPCCYCAEPPWVAS